MVGNYIICNLLKVERHTPQIYGMGRYNVE